MCASLIGKTLLNQYLVQEFVASGGMGTVYQVWDTHRNVPLAMKVLHADLADDPSIYKRFKREANALEKLAHPNIVPFYGLHSIDHLDFLLEQFIDGPTLKDILNTYKRLSIESALSYLKPICAALGYAHANGVIHCDIKPGNVMVDRGGIVYLADFGIARHADSTTTTLANIGTAAYMAPEQITTDVVSPQTDVYALGIMTYEMLTGQRPFTGDEEEVQSSSTTRNERIRQAHLALAPIDPRQLNPEISPQISQVILKALSKDPRNRYEDSPGYFQALLQATTKNYNDIPNRVTPSLIPASESLFHPPDSIPAALPQISSTQSAQKRPNYFWLGGGVIFVVIAFVALFMLSQSNPPNPPISGIKPTETMATIAKNVSPTIWPTKIPTSEITPTMEAKRLSEELISSHLIPLEGNGTIQLTNSQNDDYTPAIRLDQESMLYVSQLNGTWQIFEQKPSGVGSPRQITEGSVNYTYPQYSQEGNTILVEADLGGNHHIYLLDSNSGEILQQLTNSPANDMLPVWMPDYQGFLFVSTRDGNEEIYLGYLDGRPALRLTNNAAIDMYPRPSPTGERIVFSTSRDGNYEIYILNLKTGNLRRVTNDNGGQLYRDSVPTFSPDEEWILFESNRTGNYEIHAIRLDGSELRNLTNNPDGDYVPVFSPDGQWIFFQSNRNGNFDLYRMSWEPERILGGETLSSEPPNYQTDVNAIDNAEIVLIPAGEFIMGSDPDEDPYFWGAEGPAHKVYLDEYWIYRTEVTNLLYQACVEAQKCPQPARFFSRTHTEYYNNDEFANYPVIFVSYSHATAYCQWAGGRLPTEAEWEKAARGDQDERLWPWGSFLPDSNTANFLDAGMRDTMPVGKYIGDQSPYGIFDMAANVWEWTYDWFQPTYYDISPYENPLGPATGTKRSIRGGAFHNSARSIRLVTRISLNPNETRDTLGFRCVLPKP